MLGCSKRASVRASWRKFDETLLECRLVALRLRPHAHPGVAVAEVEGVVLLDGDHGAEAEVLGLVGDAEPAGADHAQDAVAAVQNRIGGQHQTTVHAPLPNEPDGTGNASKKACRAELNLPVSPPETFVLPEAAPVRRRA